MARKFLTPIDLANNELRGAVLENRASDPSSPVEGRFYHNSVSHRPLFYSGAAFLDLTARANHSGTQTASTISDLATVVQAYRLDQFAVPTASINFNSQKGINVATPTAGTDAANKAYVDSVSTGLDVKASVRAASTANVAGITYTATGGASGRGQITVAPNTLDGVTLAANDRILLKDQTTGTQNGIYVVTTVGTGANGVWDRATDFDADVEVTSGAFMFVTEGTANDNSGWVLTTNDPITIGGASGTSLAFAQFSAAGTILAGNGLTKVGSTISVVAGNGIIADGTSTRVDPAVVVRKYASDIGDGSTTSIVVTHSLGTKDVQVVVYDNTTPFADVIPDIQHTSTSTVTLVFAIAPTTAQYRVVVFG